MSETILTKEQYEMAVDKWINIYLGIKTDSACGFCRANDEQGNNCNDCGLSPYYCGTNDIMDTVYTKWEWAADTSEKKQLELEMLQGIHEYGVKHGLVTE